MYMLSFKVVANRKALYNWIKDMMGSFDHIN